MRRLPQQKMFQRVESLPRFPDAYRNVEINSTISADPATQQLRALLVFQARATAHDIKFTGVVSAHHPTTFIVSGQQPKSVFQDSHQLVQHNPKLHRTRSENSDVVSKGAHGQVNARANVDAHAS